VPVNLTIVISNNFAVGTVSAATVRRHHVHGIAAFIAFAALVRTRGSRHIWWGKAILIVLLVIIVIIVMTAFE